MSSPQKVPLSPGSKTDSYRKQSRRSFLGKYLLLQTIGEGEFAKVKLALHLETGDEFAIKLVKKEWVDTEAKLAKINREISVLKNINHPFIVRLYDIIEADKYIGLVLEYASGGELFDHILVHRYLKEKDACRLFAQLISAVSYLHKNGVVHRDLKLENLLLDWNKNIKITDFGFANFFDPNYGEYMMTSCGSPCYAAPELVISDGMYAGTAVDVWSCGVILYAMLAGYLPFDDDPTNPNGDNINKLYMYILSTELVFPDHISATAKNLLRKILVPDPKKRATMETIMAHEWLESYSYLFKDLRPKPKPKNAPQAVPINQGTVFHTESSKEYLYTVGTSKEFNRPKNDEDLVDSFQNPPQSTNKALNQKSEQQRQKESNSSLLQLYSHSSFPNLPNISTNADILSEPLLSNYSSNYRNETSVALPKARTHTIAVDDSSKRAEPSSSAHPVSIQIADPTIPSIDITEEYFPENSYLNQDFDIFKDSNKQKLVLEGFNNSNLPNKYDFNTQTSNQARMAVFDGSRPLASPNVAESSTKLHDNLGFSFNQPSFEKDDTADSLNSNSGNTSDSGNVKQPKSPNAKKAEYILGKPHTEPPIKPSGNIETPKSDIPKIHSNFGEELGIKIGDGIASYPIRMRSPKLLSDKHGNRAFNWVAKQSRRITSSGGEIAFNSIGKSQNRQNLDTSKKKPRQRFQLQEVSFTGEKETVQPSNIKQDHNLVSTQDSLRSNPSSFSNTEIQLFVLKQPEILQQMRTYNGPINPLALSSMPPSELFQHVLQTLDNLGLVVISTNGLSARVLRPKMENTYPLQSLVIGATYPILLPQASENKIYTSRNLGPGSPKQLDSSNSSVGLALNHGTNPQVTSQEQQSANANVLDPNIDNKLVNHANLIMGDPWASSSAAGNIPPHLRFIKTKPTYVSPQYETTPVDGSLRDRGIHGQFNKTRQDKTKPLQISSLAIRLKNLKVALSKNSKQSQLKAAERSPQETRKVLKNPTVNQNSDTRSGGNESTKYTIDSQNKGLNSDPSSQGYSVCSSSIEDTVLFKQASSSRRAELSASHSTPPSSNLESDSIDQAQNPKPKYVPAKCAPVPPPYGQPHLDKKDEVQFVIEVCKLKNLSHLFVVTSKRRKGSVWAYKYLYYLFMESLSLKNYGNPTTNPYASIIVPINNNVSNVAQTTFNSSNSSSFPTPPTIPQQRNSSNNDVKKLKGKHSTLRPTSGHFT